MQRYLPVLLSMLTLLGITCKPSRAENWPGWRGPRGDGTSLEKNVPLRWNGPTGENITWRVPVPGRAHSSPIVWENRLFVSTCLEDDLQRQLLCFDRDQGRLLWQQTVVEAPLEKKHQLNSYASGTPVTDGKLVYVTYLEPDFGSITKRTPGNIVVAAFDFEGRQQWKVRPGRFASVHGYCTSPILFKNLLIVNGDHDGDSFVYGLDKRTGEIEWKTARKHKTRSYCTPIIREIDGRTQMVFSGSMCVVSLDPHDGSEHWRIDGPTEQFVASLVYDGNLLYLTAGYPEHHILAIQPDGQGNVTDTHIVWRTTRGCSYVPSPIVEGPYFLVASDEGIVSCFEGATGRRLWMKRMAPHYSASLVSAGGYVYLTDDDGITKVVRPGPDLDLVAENRLGEACYASAAISAGQIFMRGEQHLYCIGKPTADTPPPTP
jgi:outer membrane protein assembly factor BamB